LDAKEDHGLHLSSSDEFELKFPKLSRAKMFPSQDVSEPSPAKLELFNFRAETQPSIFLLIDFLAFLFCFVLPIFKEENKSF
jgi:hypothetical protein